MTKTELKRELIKRNKKGKVLKETEYFKNLKSHQIDNSPRVRAFRI